MTKILVVYHSRLGSVQTMADLIARGVASVAGCEAVLRTVPNVASTIETPGPAVPSSGPPYATLEELSDCDGLLLGSPPVLAICLLK